MITGDGRRFIKRYLAGQAGTLVGAISVGVGSTPASLNDKRLQFEFARVPVIVTDYDFANDQLVFKGTLPDTVEGAIYEIGLWTTEVNALAGNQESRIITTFDSTTEEWSPKTFDTENTRLGDDSLKLTPAASATASALLTGLTLNLGDYTPQDNFVASYFVGNANAAFVRFRLRTDASNYYEFNVAAPTAGYKFTEFKRSTASVVGTPDWADITEVQVVVVAKAAGTASVQFDGLRVEDDDSISPEYGMIARNVLSTAILKTEGTVRDIEYALPVNIS